MSSEVKHYWPEEIVGTGELVVYLQDYAALEAENTRLRSDLEFLAEYILGRACGRALTNYEALGRYPLDVAKATLAQRESGQ